MYAIVEIAGQQFKVEKNQKLFVHRLNQKEGSKVSFDNVLLLDDGKKIDIGTPVINSASVEAKVINHLKGDKVIVFKKKRRKGYKTKNGHRQFLTELLIEKINEKKTTKAATKKTTRKTEIDSEKKSVKLKSKAKKPVTAKKVKNISEKTVSKKNVQK
ncbi:MAG: 50S ribosomal protein L21 [Flavobacteriaceae bacterium]|nr:50S ribosomal protein L21 [Flavobacteriaceae bacterium]|tara:strand:- start:3720 stop:4193 length:474 start_codon:yes stop_codon:yes gene_type:complete